MCYMYEAGKARRNVLFDFDIFFIHRRRKGSHFLGH